jgi:uroporphyrinogen III methyltransferase/synthase
VEAFFARAERLGRDARAFGRARVCAIGRRTAAALAARGVRADLVPEEYVSDSLAAAFRRVPVRGRRFLLPRSDRGREVLPDTLRRLGGRVTEVEAYRTVPAPAARARLRDIADAGLDWITLASSETARNFAAAAGTRLLAALQGRARVASIGPVTSAAARAAGFRVDAEAPVHTIEGLVEAMERAECPGPPGSNGT